MSSTCATSVCEVGRIHLYPAGFAPVLSPSGRAPDADVHAARLGAQAAPLQGSASAQGYPDTLRMLRRIVPSAALTQPRKPGRERPREPDPIGGLGQQRRAGVVDGLIVSVRRHRHSDLAAIALHPQGDPPELGSLASTTRRIPAQADVQAPRPRPGRSTSRTIRARSRGGCPHRQSSATTHSQAQPHGARERATQKSAPLAARRERSRNRSAPPT